MPIVYVKQNNIFAKDRKEYEYRKKLDSENKIDVSILNKKEVKIIEDGEDFYSLYFSNTKGNEKM